MPSGPSAARSTYSSISAITHTHRIAISNHRLLGLEGDKVSFRWRDSAHNNKQRVMALRVEEFLRRYFLHVLPPGFVRIRHFGLFANRLRKVSIETCRRLLGDSGAPPPASADTDPATTFWACPDCGSPMVLIERLSATVLIERLTPAQTYVRPPPSSEVPA